MAQDLKELITQLQREGKIGKDIAEFHTANLAMDEFWVFQDAAGRSETFYWSSWEA